MEYYENMRPEKPFNALVVGQVVPIYQIRTYVDPAAEGSDGQPPHDRELGDYH